MAGPRRRYFIAVLVIAVGLFGGLLLSPPVGAVAGPHGAGGAAANKPAWETALGFGRSVSLDSPTDGWMVQYCNGIKSCKDNVATSSLMHWNGTSWSSVTSLNGYYVESVIAESPTDAWASGSADFTPDGAALLHWDGAHWTNVPVPGAVRNSTLWGLSADSPTDAWAVGYNDRVDGSSASFILHWNGMTWSQVPSPSPGSDSNSYQLRSVSAVSSTNAWAVGFSTNASGASNSFILHWNGSKWLQFTSPTSVTDNAQLSSVSATAGGGWAVGTTSSGDSMFSPLVLRLNAGAWSEVSSPDLGANGGMLNAVSTISPTDAWLVGDQCQASNCVTENGLIEHWNGHVWAAVDVPLPTSYNQLFGVATDGASDAWAVGSDQGVLAERVLALRWNGKRWSKFWPA